MTRKNQVIEHGDIDGNNQIAINSNQIAALSAQIIKEYGHDVPYDRSHFLNKARGHIMRSAEEALELGRCLIVMKEHEPHGEWTGVLEELSLDKRLAQRTMQAAVKFSNASSTTHLLNAAKSKTKLFELMILDDEELEQLNDGGTVAGINLDDVEKMSVSELRAAIRKAREELDDQAGVIETKNKKIDEQSKKINRIRKQAPDETVTQMRAEIASLQNTIEFDIRQNLFNAFNALQEIEGDDHNEFIKAQITQLEEALAFARQSFVVGEEWEQS